MNIARTRMCSFERLIYFSVLSLFVVGCSTFPESEGAPPSEVVVNARQQIAQNRENTQLLASRLKRQYAGRETEPAYIKSRDLYDAAMVQNNSWVTSLKLGMAGHENLETSQAFRDKAQAAADATGAFLNHGYALTHPGAEVKVLIYPAFGEIVKVLIENGIVLWKATLAERQAERLAAAERMEKELRWLSWEDVK